jgi:aryl carrier-like protein
MRNPEFAATIAGLRAVWAVTLEVSPDGIADTDDFFELGGDSMLALEVATESRRVGLEMPMSAVLRRPVLADLAAAVLDPGLFTLPPGADSAVTSEGS